MDIETPTLILTASPGLEDSFLSRAVVLLVADILEGDYALGFALNKPLNQASKLILGRKHAIARNYPDSCRPFPFYAGGTMDSAAVHFLHGPDFETDQTLTFSEPFCLTRATQKDIESAVLLGKPENILALKGYEVWSARQLTLELAEGFWIPNLFDYDLVFKHPRDTLWDACLSLPRDVEITESLKTRFLFSDQAPSYRPC